MIDITVSNDTNLPTDAADALTLIAAISMACDCMRRLGLTKDQAVSRIGKAVETAWAMTLPIVAVCEKRIGMVCSASLDVGKSTRGFRLLLLAALNRKAS